MRISYKVDEQGDGMNRRFFAKKLAGVAAVGAVVGESKACPVALDGRYRAWVKVSESLYRSSMIPRCGGDAIACGMAFFDSDGMLDSGITCHFSFPRKKSPYGTHLDFHKVHGRPDGRPEIIITEVDPIGKSGRFVFAYNVSHDGHPTVAHRGTTNNDGVLELDLSL